MGKQWVAFLLLGLAASNEIQVVPPREECAKTEENCLSQKCCKITGYSCYEVHSGYAKCMKSCTPGQDGTCLQQATYVGSKRSDISQTANTFFCFSFYTADTGSTKPSYELDLLRTQLFLGASIFGCEAYRVFSDVETWSAQGSTPPCSSQHGRRSKRRACGPTRTGSSRSMSMPCSSQAGSAHTWKRLR